MARGNIITRIIRNLSNDNLHIDDRDELDISKHTSTNVKHNLNLSSSNNSLGESHTSFTTFNPHTIDGFSDKSNDCHHHDHDGDDSGSSTQWGSEAPPAPAPEMEVHPSFSDKAVVVAVATTPSTTTITTDDDADDGGGRSLPEEEEEDETTAPSVTAPTATQTTRTITCVESSDDYDEEYDRMKHQEQQTQEDDADTADVDVPITTTAPTSSSKPKPTSTSAKLKKACSTDTVTSQDGKKKKSVSFTTLTIREYPIEIGDNPSVVKGVPITIGWEYLNEYNIGINAYEASRPNRRYKLELRTESLYRVRMLKHLGYSTNDIRECLKQVNVERSRRQRTKEILHFETLIENYEKISRAILNATLRRSTKHQERQYLQPYIHLKPNDKGMDASSSSSGGTGKKSKLRSTKCSILLSHTDDSIRSTKTAATTKTSSSRHSGVSIS